MYQLFICLIPFIFCGGQERWSVKTLQDPEAAQINFNAMDTTVSYLASSKNFSFPIHKNSPRQMAEKQVYRVTAIVKNFFREQDGDLHLVLSDPDHPRVTMIAEIPDPECDQVEESDFEAEFLQVRDAFTSLKKSDIIGHRFTITGVLFFDVKHPTPQRGVAPNGVELHPVLYIESTK